MYRRRAHIRFTVCIRNENVADILYPIRTLSLLTTTKIGSTLRQSSFQQNRVHHQRNRWTSIQTKYVTRYHTIFRLYQDSPVLPIQWVSGRLRGLGFSIRCGVLAKALLKSAIRGAASA